MRITGLLGNALRKVSLALALASFGVATGAHAQDDWPTRPLTIVVPFDAGGSADRMARSLAEHMSPRLGVPIQVVNRPGGAGALGVTYFHQQPADGSHLLVMQATPYLSSAILVGGAPVEWSDFHLLNAQWNDYAVVAVHNDNPYQSFAELVEAMREPGKVSSGIIVGNGGHIQTLMMMQELDIPEENVRFVTYSGGAPLRAALAGNQVDFQLFAAEAAASIQDRMRVLAVADEEHAEQWGVPTLNEVVVELGGEPMPLVGGNITGPIVHASLKDEYPERYEKILNAYREALQSEEYQRWAEEGSVGADWIGPEESQATVDRIFEALSEYAEIVN